ncbi:MAG: hypothetical protein WBP93_20430 [Pyrinomonadaceae bacterium]
MSREVEAAVKQHEAVIQAMRENGGYATLGHLYRTATRIPDSHWKGTKTPFASIRRIVQEHKEFFKIRPGLWALESERKAVLSKLALDAKADARNPEEFNHSYYQGLLVQIGNLNNYETFVPNQDKNRLFLSRKLSDISTMKQFHNFTYDSLLKRARTIDVSWFNQRQLPEAFFEVEHSTDIQNSLLKFLEFQDFRIKFYIVADNARRKEFESKIARHVFKPIRSEVVFRDYDYVADWHSKMAALADLDNR